MVLCGPGVSRQLNSLGLEIVRHFDRMEAIFTSVHTVITSYLCFKDVYLLCNVAALDLTG